MKFLQLNHAGRWVVPSWKQDTPTVIYWTQGEVTLTMCHPMATITAHTQIRPCQAKTVESNVSDYLRHIYTTRRHPFLTTIVYLASACYVEVCAFHSRTANVSLAKCADGRWTDSTNKCVVLFHWYLGLIHVWRHTVVEQLTCAGCYSRRLPVYNNYGCVEKYRAMIRLWWRNVFHILTYNSCIWWACIHHPATVEFAHWLVLWLYLI